MVSIFLLRDHSRVGRQVYWPAVVVTKNNHYTAQFRYTFVLFTLIQSSIPGSIPGIAAGIYQKIYQEYTKKYTRNRTRKCNRSRTRKCNTNRSSGYYWGNMVSMFTCATASVWVTTADTFFARLMYIIQAWGKQVWYFTELSRFERIAGPVAWTV